MARPKYCNDLGKKKSPLFSKKKDVVKTKGVSVAGTCKVTKKTSSIMMPLMKQGKMTTETDPLFVNLHNNAYEPYFKEYKGKRAPNFTAVEGLVLC